MNSPNPTPPDARETLRNLIAEKIHASDCGCKDFRPDGTDADDAYYRRHADAVMELFPEVSVELERRTPGLVLPISKEDAAFATHRRYVAGAAPQPVEETPR